ncbi:hypothetical protein SAMN05877753_104109 [Bacillus oleivorans]|uniref:Probable queuosine precursor transporter n=1 Tax=Bacillus oleivorans TaxID=1448271 RepID=A0A285CS54_9BACI|nr:queuosine precursor transporter [Bacillus oleivorans]SNX70419.1 hypothetical protein SAMN05877753_104109 [Bacillus oleivorans]
MINQPKDQLFTLYSVLFATSLVVANVTATKVVSFGDTFVIPAAVVTYAFTFLLTDIIHERYGKEQAQKTVFYGFIAQLFASVMILIGMVLPAAPFAQSAQEAYEVLLGPNLRNMMASLIAYLISQNIDVHLFSFLKNKFNGKHKWIRNNVSTISSQFIDTAVFITIAFAGQVPSLWAMIWSQFAIKCVLALLDTPLFYLLTRKNKTQANSTTVSS